MKKYLRIIIGVIAAVGIALSLFAAFGRNYISTDFYSPDNKGVFSVEEQDGKIICKTISNDIAMDIRGNDMAFYSLMGDDLLTYADEDNFDHSELDKYNKISTFLDHYNSSDYIVIIAVAGDGRLGFDYEDALGMTDSGLHITPSDGEVAFSYLAVKRHKKIYYEESALELLSFSKKIKGHMIDAESAGDGAGTYARLSIDGVDYYTGNRGINFVVYDLKDSCVADCAWIDRDFSDTIRRKYNMIDIEHEFVFSDSLQYIIDRSSYTGTFVIRSFFVTIALLILLAGLHLVYYLTDFGYKIEGKAWVSRIRFFLIFLYLTVTEILIVGYYFLVTNFPDVSLSQLLFHINTDLTGTSWENFSGTITKLVIGIGGTLLVCVGLYALYRLLYKKAHKNVFITVGLIGRLLIVGACLAVFFFIFQRFYYDYDVYDYMLQKSMSTTIYEEYYGDGNTAGISFPEKKKNLIYIFIESMETTPAARSAGGGMSTDYIPELSSLALENASFNGNTGVLNGAYELGSTGWTIAGMIAETAGIPLNVEVDQNEFYARNYLPGACSIGDILKKNGYTNYIMMGSDIDFAGREFYFGQHGDYTVYDYKWAKEAGVIPSDYFEWWGYEDKKMYEFAKDKLTEIAAKGEPFNFSLLTADTHFLNGYVCEDCDTQYNNQYYNVLACTSSLAYKFIEWVKQQDFYEDTVIVLSGDHLYMDKRVYDEIPADYERKVYFNVINSDRKQPDKARQYCTMDIFPTTLSALGCDIEGDRLGLGTDLYSDTETVTEILGADRFDVELGRSSEFYKKKLIY